MWLPFPSEKTFSQPKLATLLAEISEEVEKSSHTSNGSRRAETAWKALAVRALHSMSAASTPNIYMEDRVTSSAQRASCRGEYSESIKGMCNSAWNKPTKYYNLTGISVTYVAAVVLDPRVKWVYFTPQWPDWIDQAQADILTHWNTSTNAHILALIIKKLQEEVMLMANQKSQSSKSRIIHMMMKWLTSINSIVSHHACLKKVSNGQLIGGRKSQQEAYPDLSRWVIDILSIPAMSDEPERLFSRAGKTLDEGRVQLLPETVQALEYIKSWPLQKIGNEGITEHRQLDEEAM